MSSADGTACVDGRLLHVPSPDWRDQIIYFAMIDRFNDGNPDNNDHGGYYDPSKQSHYSGGDLQGIMDNLAYIKGLGASALWITPPVANQWWDPVNEFSGYHGYWARNFQAVDEHYGDLEVYKGLSHALHENGMYLIQDIVANHVGNFHMYDGAYDPENPAENFTLTTGAAPELPPFDQNDRKNPEHAAANIYHWSPDIDNFQDPQQERYFQLQGLDDLNTENPVVLAALKEAYAYWIREVGVDAFRIDTVKFVDHPFWHHFLHDPDGIEAAAAATGRSDFLTFGEVFESSLPFGDEGERKAASYLGSVEKPELKAVLGFPLYAELNRVFAEGKPTEYLRYRLEQHMSAYRDPYITPNFIDNHDVARFLSRGTLDGLKQALTVIMTIPGIPVIWQGTEQALTEPRQALFGGGYLAEEDLFNTESEMYLFIKALAELRTSHKIFTRGTMTLLADAVAGPGVLAYQRQYEGTTALVILNTAEHTSLMSQLDTGLPGGTRLSLLLGYGYTEDVVIGADGRLTMEVPPRSTLVLLDEGLMEDREPVQDTVTVNEDLTAAVLRESRLLTGRVSQPNASLRLVVDGNLTQAAAFQADAQGEFAVLLSVDSFPPGESRHSVEIYAPELGIASAQQRFTADVNPDGVIIAAADPSGDDAGPLGTYVYPRDASYSRQQDIEEAVLRTGGQTLTLTLTMREITTTWAPVNGFDHAAFTIFFRLPRKGGLSVLPQLSASGPGGFQWHLAHRVYGWNNQMYNTDGAGTDTRGANLAFAPIISVDTAGRTVTFRYDGNALGISTWDDVEVYVTTWDVDGISDAYRSLTASGGQWEYGGSTGASNPKIMDDLGPVRITPAATNGARP